MIHPLADVQTDKVGIGTKIWQFCIILPDVEIGKNCNINANVLIETGVKIGNNVTIKCGVQLWDGIIVEDDVFIGPNATFANDPTPRSGEHFDKHPITRICRRASIGANATILCGVTIGEGALIGAGSVVTHDVPPNTVWFGNPARLKGVIDENDDITYLGMDGLGGGRKKVLIIGGEGHGSVIASCLRDNLRNDPFYPMEFMGFVNDYETKIDGVPVMGCTSDIHKLAAEGYYFAWGIHLIGKNYATVKAYERMQIPKNRLVTIIHHTAYISEGTILEPGCFVMCNAYIGPRSHIGEGTMIKANSCIGHDVTIGRLCHVAMGAIVGSYSLMGECSDVAIGARVIDRSQIGNHAMLGSGGVLSHHIPEGEIHVGVPARFFKKMIQ